MNRILRCYILGIPCVGLPIFVGNMLHKHIMSQPNTNANRQVCMCAFAKTGYGLCSWAFPLYALVKHRLYYPDDLASHWKMHFYPNSYLTLKNVLSSDYRIYQAKEARAYEFVFRKAGILLN